MKNILLVALMVALTLGSANGVTPLLDLSLTYNLDPPASHQIQIIERGLNRIYIGVELNQLCTTEHSGTHLEAPRTLHDNSWSVDRIPFERLWRVPGVMMSVDPYVYEISADVFQRWEDRTGMVIPDGGVLLIRTGFETYVSLADSDDDTPKRQPALSADAGDWLANYGGRHGHTTGIVGVGIDLNSLDENNTNTSTSARSFLFESNIYALDNLNNLENMPKSGFLVTVMPMKVYEGVGAPARVMAEKDDTRSKPSVGDSSEDDDHERGSWNSESDHYEGPYWGHNYGPVYMSTGSILKAPIMLGTFVLPSVVILRGVFSV